MIVSIVHQILPCKIFIYLIFINLYLPNLYKYNCKYCSAKFARENLLLNICKYNCKHCSSNSSFLLRKTFLHTENGVIFLWMNLCTCKYEYNCKYCSANFLTKSYISIAHSKWLLINDPFDQKFVLFLNFTWFEPSL